MLNFVETDPEKIVNEMVATFEAAAGRKLAPADPYKVFIMWAANIIVQERVLINIAANRNIPQFADGKYLDALADLFHDTKRIRPTAAVVTMQFNISEARESVLIIPKGTRVTADNEIFFATDENLIIEAGQTSGTVTASCMTGGTVGNGFTAGQITTLVDVFQYYDTCTNTTISEGGAEEETDAEFYERLKLSNDTWSTAGPKGSYIYHAKSVSNAITDVKAVMPSAGKVDVYILLENGEIPGETLLNEVSAALNDEKIRPLTDTVIVKAPTEVNYSIDLTYYVSSEDMTRINDISEAVSKAVEGFKMWQCAKMGRDLNPSKLIADVMAAGAKRVNVTSPIYTALSENSVAKCTGINTKNGGVEDE